MQFQQFICARADTGAVLKYAKATVYLKGTETLAALFDEGGAPLGINPAIADANGAVGFACANGTYDIDVTSADGGYAVPRISDVQFYDLSGLDAQVDAAAASAATAATIAVDTAADFTRSAANAVNVMSSQEPDDVRSILIDGEARRVLAFDGAIAWAARYVGGLIEYIRQMPLSAAPMAETLGRYLGGNAAGFMRRTSSGTLHPILLDGANNHVLAYDADAGEYVGGLVSYLKSSTAGAAVTAAQLARAWHMSMSYGQSWSIGAFGQPVLSLTQPYSNITFTGGVKSAAGDDLAATKPLIEDDLGEDNATGTDRGETPCSSAANYCSYLAAVENGIDPASYIQLASAPGQGSQTLAAISKGTTYYARLIAQVTAANALAIDAETVLVVDDIDLKVGETDAGADVGTSYETWLAQFNQLVVDLNADIVAITGQRTPVRIITYQTAARARTGNRAVQLAQLEAVRSNPLVEFAGPVYFLPTAAADTGHLHLGNTGWQRLGYHDGRARKRIVVDGQRADYLEPISATLLGDELRVRFRCPTSPVRINTTDMFVTTDYGFQVTDDDGDPVTLSDIHADGDEIVMTLDPARSSAANVSYAFAYEGTDADLDGVATGNVCDSTDTVVHIDGDAVTLFHAAPHFALPIIPLTEA